MPGPVRLLDDSVKDAVLRYPTVDMIRRIFPNVRMRGRSILCNPLRNERHPSLSCFRDSSGIPRWKDFATEESGDNIDFFRKVYPELDYVDAVDRLAQLVLGRTALCDGMSRPRVAAVAARPVHVPKEEQPSVLRIVSDTPLLSASTPPYLVDYTRSRGISDEVSSRYCRCVVFENTNIAGTPLCDPASGVRLMGPDGRPLVRDGRSAAVAIPNGLGGYSLRVPRTEASKDFKGCNVAFYSVILADGSSPSGRVAFSGDGDGFVSYLRYDEPRRMLRIGDSQAFTGVEPWAARFALPFLDCWSGRYLEGRDLRAAVSVLVSLNGPVNTVATVVEGMFDGLSVIEIQRLLGKGVAPGTDLVILNSVTNISWAVPFLAMHSEVRSLLDNDLRSSAGQKAFNVMRDSVASYSGRCGSSCRVRSNSGLFSPYKDVNDYLVQYRARQAAVSGNTRNEKKKIDGGPFIPPAGKRPGRKI